MKVDLSRDRTSNIIQHYLSTKIIFHKILNNDNVKNINKCVVYVTQEVRKKCNLIYKLLTLYLNNYINIKTRLNLRKIFNHQKQVKD